MPTVITLALNPSIDVSSETERVRPTEKLRTTNERMDPGGGGINVARVLQRFGIDVEARFVAGGTTGRVLDELLQRQSVPRRAAWIADDTRMSLTVHERSSGQEYRFVPEGPTVTPDEHAAIETICDGECDYFIASGSLPAGVPDDIYATLLDKLDGSGARFILDTSGAELAKALGRGGIFLVKPSRRELEQMLGRELSGHGAIIAAAREIVAAGQALHVTVTLGQDGALLVSTDGAFFLPAIPVETHSAVGAGDSFLAGMTYGLASGALLLEAFRIAAAAGAATALTPGTDLCHPAEVLRLLDQVPAPQPVP
jgi:6-phosphofructokinase 2